MINAATARKNAQNKWMQNPEVQKFIAHLEDRINKFSNEGYLVCDVYVPPEVYTLNMAGNAGEDCVIAYLTDNGYRVNKMGYHIYIYF